MPEHQVKFITPSSGEISPLLKKAWDSLESRDLNPQWVTQEDVLAVQEMTKYCLYVADPFQSKAFQHVEKLGCRVYGPPCILSCSEATKPLPKQAYPLYSLSMRGLLVCFTNLECDERDRLTNLVRYMGGEVLRQLTEHVTHLVANQVGSKKYIVATSRSIPVMLPIWVDKAWVACTKGKIHAASEDFKKFQCPIFQGISVSVSGLDHQERKRVQAALEDNGGIYSGEMRRNTTTHLITTEPKGQKYSFAAKWKIHIVHPQWLHDSLHDGYCKDESLYAVTQNKTSTPTKNDEVLKGAGARLSSMGGLTNDVSSIMSHSMMNITSVNETMSSSMCVNNANNTTIMARPVKDCIEDLEMKSSDLLDGCKIYLSGFCGERLDKMRKFVSMASGTRFNVINDDITHVIVNGKVGQSLRDGLADCQCQPPVVGLQWLVDCQKAGKLIPEHDYLCVENIPEEKFSPVLKRLAPKVVSRPEVKENATPAQDDKEMSDLLSFYMSANNDTTNDTTKGPDETDVTKTEDPDVTVGGDVNKNDDVNNDPDVTKLDDNDATKTDNQCDEDNDVTRCEDNDVTTLGTEDVTSAGVFQGKMFIIVGFEPEGEAELKTAVTELGGLVKSAKRGGVCDYAVVPPLGSTPVQAAVDEVVTSFWLLQCHDENIALDLDKNMFFRPLAVNNRNQLTGCVLAITGFSGGERDCLLHLAKLMGAVVQEYFCRKTTAKAQASTHLLASVPDGLHGSKYEAAKKLNIPIICKEWLFKCAQTGTRLPENQYVAGENVESDKLEKPSTGNKTEEKKTEKEKEPEKKVMAPPTTTPIAQPSPKPTETPTAASNAKTPSQRRSRVAELQESSRTPASGTKDLASMTPNTALANIQFDLTDMLQEFETPANEKHKRKSSLPLEDLYTHHINIALRRFEHPEEFESPAPPDSQNQDSEEDKPLKGVVIAVSKKLADKQSEYFNMVSSLGGDYRWAYDTSCTHYIAQGRADSSKEYKMAKEKVKYIVSPYWLIMCEQQNSRVDEGLFPANFNPSMSLCVTTPRPTPVTRRQARLHQPTDSTASPALVPSRQGAPTPIRQGAPTRGKDTKPPVFDDEDEDDHVSKKSAERAKSPVLNNLNLDAKTPEKVIEKLKDKAMEEVQEAEAGSMEMHHAIQKELEDIMASSKPASANSAPRRKSRRPQETGTGNRSRLPRTRSTVEDEDACSQQAEITWDDPNSRKEREKFVDVLHKPYSPTQHPDTQHEPEPVNQLHKEHSFILPAPSPRPAPRDQENQDSRPPPTPEPPSLIFPRPKPALCAPSPQPLDPPSVTSDVPVERKFLLSGMTPEEKDSYGALIETLGGVLLEANTFDSRCTHLIAGQPTRNEKCLASIASGKWILHKSYLEACKSAGNFVKEDEHEWGSPSSLAVKSWPSSVVKLSEAAHRWRVKLERKKETGAFHDWKVLMCTPKNKTGGFKRLLEAGGARVLSVRPPYSQYLEIASHVFMDLAKCEVEIDLNEFSRAGLRCYKPEFIAGFLMDEFLDHDAYLIPQLSNNNNVANGGKKRKSSGSSTEVTKKSKLT